MSENFEIRDLKTLGVKKNRKGWTILLADIFICACATVAAAFVIGLLGKIWYSIILLGWNLAGRFLP